MIYTSDRDASSIVIPDTPVHEYALRHAQRLGDKPALIDGPSGRTLTYAEPVSYTHLTLPTSDLV